MFLHRFAKVNSCPSRAPLPNGSFGSLHFLFSGPGNLLVDCVSLYHKDTCFVVTSATHVYGVVAFALLISASPDHKLREGV